MSPVCEFITEASLNSPSKGEEFTDLLMRCYSVIKPVFLNIFSWFPIKKAAEGNENGTLCSETTPLPISTDVEQGKYHWAYLCHDSCCASVFTVSKCSHLPFCASPAETTETQAETESGATLLSFK